MHCFNIFNGQRTSFNLAGEILGWGRESLKGSVINFAWIASLAVDRIESETGFILQKMVLVAQEHIFKFLTGIHASNLIAIWVSLR